MTAEPAAPQSEPERPTRSVREGVAMSVLVLAVGSFSVIGASANAPLLSSALGLSEVGIGAIASVAYVGAMSSARVSGRITDRRGPAVVIIAGLVLMALGDGIALSAFHASVLYLGIVVVGLGYGAINPSTTVVSNPRSAKRRGLVMSVKQSGVPLGGVAAGAVIPSVGLAFGWRAAFGLALVLCLALALFVWLRGGYRARPPATRVAPRARGGRRMALPWGYTFGLLIAGVQVSMFAFTAVYLVDARGLSIARAGLGVSILLIGGVVGRLFWGWLSDVFFHQRLLVLQGAALLGAVSIALLVVAPDTVLPLVLVAIGVSSVGWNGVYIAAVAEAVEPHRMGAATGTSLALINFGAIVTPLLIGVLVSLTGSWSVGLLTLAALSVAASIVALVFSEPGPTPAVV